MYYLSLSKKTVISLSGRSVTVEPNKPTYAPPNMHEDMINAGCSVAETTSEEELLEVENTGVPRDPEIRKKHLFKAFDTIANRQVAGDFTAAGLPHVAALQAITGWAVSHKERETLWHEYRANLGTK